MENKSIKIMLLGIAIIAFSGVMLQTIVHNYDGTGNQYITLLIWQLIIPAIGALLVLYGFFKKDIQS